ncbi:UPF0715 family protein [Niallia circulans]|uniref:UPF0715 family protein n=1 Tax=Niallia circulans TaxID=1397 RepID=UPI0015611AC5|nr:UPF0715 family protein [Niallia circulans]
MLTSLISAICVSTIYLISSSYFSLLGILIFSFIFFCFYLIIASPLQILLNQRPRKFSIIYLAIYNIFSEVVTWIVAMFFDMKDPFHSSIFYFLFILCASLFWIVDSLLLQKKAE